MKFLSQPLSFDKVTICQHTFDAAAPHVLRLQQPYTLALSSPCAMATEVAAVVSTPRCRVSPGPTGSSQWAHAAIPNSSPNRTNVTLATCQQLTIDHRECAPAALAESSCERCVVKIISALTCRNISGVRGVQITVDTNIGERPARACLWQGARALLSQNRCPARTPCSASYPATTPT